MESPDRRHQLVGCPVEQAQNVNGAKRLQMLLTPEEEVAGRVATCDGSVDHLFGWCTQRSQCFPCGPVRARLVSASWDSSRPGVLPATLGSCYASAVGDPSKPPTLQACWTWPPSTWQRHPCKPQRAWRPVPGALLPEETKGLTTGWRFGGRPEWLGPGACRAVTPTSGLGHGASVEAVSYGAAPAAWLLPQQPYAPGASETVSVVPPSCSWTYLSSSTPTERVPAWGALSDWPSLTPYREKRSSASGRVYSFPSWPVGPTRWGARAPNPCVRITDAETEPVWASHRGSWECALSREQGLPPLLSWRHGAIGTARRAGPCTDRPALRIEYIYYMYCVYCIICMYYI